MLKIIGWILMFLFTIFIIGGGLTAAIISWIAMDSSSFDISQFGVKIGLLTVLIVGCCSVIASKIL